MSQIGYNPNTPQATPDQQGKSFNLGDRYEDDNGDEFVYVQADGAVTGAGYVCFVTPAYQAKMVTTANALLGSLLAVPPVAFADNDYGWMQVKGPCVVRVAANAAANVALNTTTTGGELDDDGTAGATLVSGIFLTTANSSSAATAAAVINWPILGVGVTSTLTRPQGAPVALTVTAGITAAALVGGLITTTGASAPSIHQLPTGTEIDTALPGIATGQSVDFSLINTGTGASDDATITVNTDVTIIGSPTVGALTDATIVSGSGRFRARRTGTHVYVVYRIA